MLTSAYSIVKTWKHPFPSRAHLSVPAAPFGGLSRHNYEHHQWEFLMGVWGEYVRDHDAIIIIWSNGFQKLEADNPK